MSHFQGIYTHTVETRLLILLESCTLFLLCFNYQGGHNPLHLASRAGHTEVVRCLLLSGADPEVLNKVSRFHTFSLF